MPLPPDLPVPSTSRVLRPRSRTSVSSRPGSSNSHGSVSGNGPQTANMAANPNNPSPTFPAHNGLIGPGRSAERPADSSNRAMEGEDVNQWWGSYPYPGSYVAPLGPGDGFGYANDELSGNSIHYPPNLSTGTPYTYDNFNYQNPYGRWEEPFGGFPGPSVGSGESSLAGALGEKKKRKREDSTTDANFGPLPGPSHIGYVMDNNWAPPYAGPSHLGSHFDYREPSSSQSGSGSMDTGYFDRFPIHDADGQAPTGGINQDLATHANDTTEPDRKGKGKARDPITQNEPSGPVEPEIQSPPKQFIPSPSSEAPTTSSSSKATTTKPTKPPADPLSDYTCPICFSAPTNATITPCGHICCGSCLFAAVKAGIQRAGMEHHPGGNRGRGAAQARCPVCRSIIPGWDGKGGGVIGLKVRAIFSF